MPGERTEITEIATALGMLSSDLDSAVAHRPAALSNVPRAAWDRLVEAHASGSHADSFATAFANGRSFLTSVDGLRGRPPRIVEWKGPHRPPGDDVIPADLRIDHVYLVSCKYLSKVLLNPSPSRLFENLLVGDRRGSPNWFSVTASTEFQAFYSAAATVCALPGLPNEVGDLTKEQQRSLKRVFSDRSLPPELRAPWSTLCVAVASGSSARWQEAMTTPKDRLRLLWRMLRISNATYFILGTDRTAHLRLRVDSMWDWNHAHELRSFVVAPRAAGQPEATWQASVRSRGGGPDVLVDGHVEIRWSHGRFVGLPEAKVYLDTPHSQVPGYHALG